jgi:hypothetical protein
MSSFISYIPASNPYSCILNPNPGYTRDCKGTTKSSSSSNSGGGPSTTPLPSLQKQFTLYKNMLPITIPSTISPTDSDFTKNYPDKDVANYWISGNEIPSIGYNGDITNDGSGIITDISKWTFFNQALSKCIELDGTNGKPNCYAVVVQSDFQGISGFDDSTYHTYAYQLVEQPTTAKIAQKVPAFASTKTIDNNYLFCQSQFYTWIKNDPINYPNGYNPTAPTINTCPIESYDYIDRRTPPNNNGFGSSFFSRPPSEKVEIPFVAAEGIVKPKNNYTYIIIGAVAVVAIGGIYYWYTTFGPGADDTTSKSLPIKPTTTHANINKTKGGYFYY